MERVCINCTRTSVRSQRSLYNPTYAASLRTFTTSIWNRAEDSPRTRESGSSASSKQRQIQPASSARVASPINTPPRGAPLIRRVEMSFPDDQASRDNRTPPGMLLRRSGPPLQPGQILRRTGPPQPGTRPGLPGTGNVQQGRSRRRKTVETAKVEEEEKPEPPTEEEMEKIMKTYVDPPVNPTERLDYNPQPQPLAELRKDWPNTPMSNAGLSALVIQKIEWLAKRLPHGYHTPEQLAEHFRKGNLTMFESEEEKQQVLKIASELAQQRATELSERKGSEVAAEDMGISELSTREDKQKIIGQLVKGDFGELEKQRMPFLDSIVRNLRNNETYQQRETESFMSTIQRLMPAQAQRRPQQPMQQKKA